MWKVSILIGAAAAPRLSKAVKIIEQCMIAKSLVPSTAAGSSKLEHLIIGNGYTEKASSIFFEEQGLTERAAAQVWDLARAEIPYEMLTTVFQSKSGRSARHRVAGHGYCIYTILVSLSA